MKTGSKTLAGGHSPTKTELVAWVNSILPASVSKIKDISELGNGVAYLYIMNEVRPGCVRLQKIAKQACSIYEINSNLKMLLACFQKLELPFRFEIDKVAQMKYQDNYHLASFLYKLDKAERENKDDNSNLTAKSSKVKIVPPNNFKNIPIHKNPPPPVTPLNLAALKSHKNRPIDMGNIEQPANNEKLTKIASILKIGSKQTEEHSIRINSATVNHQLKTFTMQQSYKRILRKTVCQRSKYLNSFSALHAQKDSCEWQQKQQIGVQPLGEGNSLFQWQDKFDDQMLLSSKKKEEIVLSQKKKFYEDNGYKRFNSQREKQQKSNDQLEGDTKLYEDQSISGMSGQGSKKQFPCNQVEIMGLQNY